MEFIAFGYTIWAILMFALIALSGPFLIGTEKKQKTFTAWWYIVAVLDTGLTAILLGMAYL